MFVENDNVAKPHRAREPSRSGGNRLPGGSAPNKSPLGDEVVFPLRPSLLLEAIISQATRCRSAAVGHCCKRDCELQRSARRLSERWFSTPWKGVYKKRPAICRIRPFTTDTIICAAQPCGRKSARTSTALFEYVQVDKTKASRKRKRESSCCFYCCCCCRVMGCFMQL